MIKLSIMITKLTSKTQKSTRLSECFLTTLYAWSWALVTHVGRGLLLVAKGGAGQWPEVVAAVMISGWNCQHKWGATNVQPSSKAAQAKEGWWWWLEEVAGGGHGVAGGRTAADCSSRNWLDQRHQAHGQHPRHLAVGPRRGEEKWKLILFLVFKKWMINYHSKVGLLAKYICGWNLIP